MKKEQENNLSRMQEIDVLISEEEHSEDNVQMFMGEIKRYAAITELDETALNRLISRILIGEPKKVPCLFCAEHNMLFRRDFRRWTNHRLWEV